MATATSTVQHNRTEMKKERKKENYAMFRMLRILHYSKENTNQHITYLDPQIH